MAVGLLKKYGEAKSIWTGWEGSHMLGTCIINDAGSKIVSPCGQPNSRRVWGVLQSELVAKIRGVFEEFRLVLPTKCLQLARSKR
jgi:hypothetical protein